ncbi:MAG: HNH endonuclease [Polyangiaceae bacterium]
MAVSPEARAAVRVSFRGRCGYCGVSEAAVGGELEVDHFHPVSAGGSDEIGNLVYACTACNRFKGDYASGDDTPDSLRLLHPGRDDPGQHVAEAAHGNLVGITPRGFFHIQRLHLNRPLLVEMRRLNRIAQAENEELSRARAAEARLRQENAVLQAEIAKLRAAIADLLRRAGG